jgi:hypothetical protein
MSDLDKRKVVCPLSLKFGAIQNYRVTERPNADAYESRPVMNTDKYAHAFYSVLQAPKGEDVEVTVMGKTWTEKGLGQPDAKALKFPHEVGVAARAKAIQMVNSGEIRAPRKNWDANFVSEGGTPLDELKKLYPDLYNAPSGRKAKEEPTVEEEEVHLPEEGEAAEGLSEPLTQEDLEGLEFEEELEETYHVSTEELTEEVHGRMNETITIPVAEGQIVSLKGNVFKCMMDDEEVTYYKVRNPYTGMLTWMQEGMNTCPDCTVNLVVEHTD